MAQGLSGQAAAQAVVALQFANHPAAAAFWAGGRGDHHLRGLAGMLGDRGTQHKGAVLAALVATQPTRATSFQGFTGAAGAHI